MVNLCFWSVVFKILKYYWGYLLLKGIEIKTKAVKVRVFKCKKCTFHFASVYNSDQLKCKQWRWQIDLMLPICSRESFGEHDYWNWTEKKYANSPLTIFLTLLHSAKPKLHRVLAILSAIGLKWHHNSGKLCFCRFVFHWWWSLQIPVWPLSDNRTYGWCAEC